MLTVGRKNLEGLPGEGFSWLLLAKEFGSQSGIQRTFQHDAKCGAGTGNKSPVRVWVRGVLGHRTF